MGAKEQAMSMLCVIFVLSILIIVIGTMAWQCYGNAYDRECECCKGKKIVVQYGYMDKMRKRNWDIICWTVVIASVVAASIPFACYGLMKT